MNLILDKIERRALVKKKEEQSEIIIYIQLSIQLE